MIRELAERLNLESKSHPFGRFQDLRVGIKGLSRRPTDNIFTSLTTSDDWAFHHGGRTELQFNIGSEQHNGQHFIRSGVAFSLELSQTLKTIDVLVPKIRRFNDYVKAHIEELGEYRMWHFIRGKRSSTYFPAPIPPELVNPNTFIFIGRMQLAESVDSESILSDFMYLFPVYEYVETANQVSIQRSQSPKFNFQPGHKSKKSNTSATYAERELSVALRHNDIQENLVKHLRRLHGHDSVQTEAPNGIGGRVDLVLRLDSEYELYEIKVGTDIRSNIRCAIGQLLEYTFWPGTIKAQKLVIVSDADETPESKTYLKSLTQRLGIPVEYLKILP
jgi:hypothetical protein